MTKNKKSSYPPVNLGTSFMLVIFIILCMVIFSVLSLSSAIKDQNYSIKNAERTLAYYNANNKAEEYLAQIDHILSDTDSFDALKNKLIKMNDSHIFTWDTENNRNIHYYVPINDSEVLEVVLAIHPQKETNYTILTWKQCSISEWNGDATLHVLGND